MIGVFRSMTRLLMLLFLLLLYGFGAQVSSEEEDSTPRFTTLNPYAWRGLPMQTVMADFQMSDGIFSSFICDEVSRRFVADTEATLQSLSEIEGGSHIEMFTLCYSPEIGAPEGVIKAVTDYATRYPQLFDELMSASEEPGLPGE